MVHELTRIFDAELYASRPLVEPARECDQGKGELDDQGVVITMGTMGRGK